VAGLADMLECSWHEVVGLQLLMVLVYFIESMFIAGSALQQQQDLLGTGASRLQCKSGAKAKAKGLGQPGGLKCKQAALRQQQLHYLLATGRALHSEKQIATCPGASRICFKERLCSPVMGLDSGLAAWLPPQDLYIIGAIRVFLRAFLRSVAPFLIVLLRSTSGCRPHVFF
jgi:hypothetical protein